MMMQTDIHALAIEIAKILDNENIYTDFLLPIFATVGPFAVAWYTIHLQNVSIRVNYASESLIRFLYTAEKMRNNLILLKSNFSTRINSDCINRMIQMARIPYKMQEIIADDKGFDNFVINSEYSDAKVLEGLMKKPLMQLVQMNIFFMHIQNYNSIRNDLNDLSHELSPFLYELDKISTTQGGVSLTYEFVIKNLTHSQIQRFISKSEQIIAYTDDLIQQISLFQLAFPAFAISKYCHSAKLANKGRRVGFSLRNMKPFISRTTKVDYGKARAFFDIGEEQFYKLFSSGSEDYSQLLLDVIDKKIDLKAEFPPTESSKNKIVQFTSRYLMAFLLLMPCILVLSLMIGLFYSK
jgi:hypothetical protein